MINDSPIKHLTAEEWNSRYPVGTKVKYYPVSNTPQFIITKTRSEAWTLASGHNVVSIEGQSGGCFLRNIEILGDDC